MPGRRFQRVQGQLHHRGESRAERELSEDPTRHRDPGDGRSGMRNRTNFSTVKIRGSSPSLNWKTGLSANPPTSPNAKKIVMIQCVGSRNKERPNCSRTCCATAVKNALKLKELNPDAEITILYRDVRTYGLAEPYYAKARKQGSCSSAMSRREARSQKGWTEADGFLHGQDHPGTDGYNAGSRWYSPRQRFREITKNCLGSEAAANAGRLLPGSSYEAAAG